MKKKNGDNDKVVDLNQFRKEKFTLNIRVGGYYANLELGVYLHCLLYTSPSPRDATLSRMPSSA